MLKIEPDILSKKKLQVYLQRHQRSPVIRFLFLIVLVHSGHVGQGILFPASCPGSEPAEAKVDGHSHLAPGIGSISYIDRDPRHTAYMPGNELDTDSGLTNVFLHDEDIYLIGVDYNDRGIYIPVAEVIMSHALNGSLPSAASCPRTLGTPFEMFTCI